MKTSKSNRTCPSCGSSECASLASSVSHTACPKCKSKLVVGIVKARSLELALVEWTCAICLHVWSDSCVLPREFTVDALLWSYRKQTEKALMHKGVKS